MGTNDNLPNRTAQEELTEQLRIGFINMEAILFYVARNVQCYCKVYGNV